MARGGRRPGAGRKPKPIADHVAEGTHRPDRHGPVEPVVKGAGARRPPLPPGLNDREKRAWKRLLDDLEASALIDYADAPLYEAFAVQWARMREARAAIHKHGLVVRGPQGGLVANPAVRLERDAINRVTQLADQLGIGQRTRASLNMQIARGRRGDAGDGDLAPPAASAASRIGPSPRLRAVEGGQPA